MARRLTGYIKTNSPLFKMYQDLGERRHLNSRNAPLYKQAQESSTALNEVYKKLRESEHQRALAAKEKHKGKR